MIISIPALKWKNSELFCEGYKVESPIWRGRVIIEEMEVHYEVLPSDDRSSRVWVSLKVEDEGLILLHQELVKEQVLFEIIALDADDDDLMLYSD